MGTRLHSLLDSFDAAPFTLQRLCEVLLEPRKQYARLEKVVSTPPLLLLFGTCCLAAAVWQLCNACCLRGALIPSPLAF